MYIRCPDCKTSTWAQDPDGAAAPPADDVVVVECKGCGADHRLAGFRELGATPRERHARAVEYADRFGVDLAGAFSSLLGLLPPPPPEALADEIGDDDPDPSVGEDPIADPPADATVTYDPGFRKAIAEGLLTPEQARELGDRDAAASRLARSHHLPMEFALDVVDHRLSLFEAVRRAPLVRTEVVVESVPANSWQKALVVGLVTLVCAAIAIHGWNRWAELKGDARRAEGRTAAEASTAPHDRAPEPAAQAQSKRAPGTEAPRAEVEIDESGRPLKVTARSPQEVLDAFCTAGISAGRYRAEDIIGAANGARLGKLRDLDNLDRTLAILIRRDRSTGRWSAGSGLAPIEVGDAPDGTVSRR